MAKSEQRKRKTFDLRLSKFELLHLRDIFNIKLPPDLKTTVSQALATAEDRSMIEARLWLKLVEACKEAEVPLDHEAPDFICAASSSPAVGVFRLATEPEEGQVQPEEGNVFEAAAKEDDEEDEDEVDDDNPLDLEGRCRNCGKKHKNDVTLNACWSGDR